MMVKELKKKVNVKNKKLWQEQVKVEAHQRLN